MAITPNTGMIWAQRGNRPRSALKLLLEDAWNKRTNGSVRQVLPRTPYYNAHPWPGGCADPVGDCSLASRSEGRVLCRHLCQQLCAQIPRCGGTLRIQVIDLTGVI